MKSSTTPPEIQPSMSVSNPGLAAFAVARGEAIFMGTKIDGGRLLFVLQLSPGITLAKLYAAFNGNGEVPGRVYGQTLSAFRKLVNQFLRETERAK